MRLCYVQGVVLLPVASSWFGVCLALAGADQPPPLSRARVVAPSTVALLAPAVETPSGPRRADSRVVRKSVRRFRRGGGLVLGAGVVGLGAAVGIQIGRGALLRRCARTGDLQSDACVASTELDVRLRVYSAMGLAMMVAGSAGAGGMFGNAAATRDIEQRRRAPKAPTFAKFTGIVTMGIASAWVLGRNIHFWHQELRCDGDLGCIASVRPKRWLFNDIGTLAISLGAGMVGYSLTYARQGKALMALRAQPSVGPTRAGASLSLTF